MCICVNCRHVNSCETYYFISTQHNQIKQTNIVKFKPSRTLIKVNISSHSEKDIKVDWDLVECLSFVEDPGKWLIK
uniref:Ycf34 n=1 Tax=Spyridia filamentosa TaxID=196632 RepID=A0A1Z1MK88_SPYFI|nr:hypothetical protein [Spyridia filamentosa]ARW66174.1 hypothetical protein [Spyridia filamentosa]